MPDAWAIRVGTGADSCCASAAVRSRAVSWGLRHDDGGKVPVVLQGRCSDTRRASLEDLVNKTSTLQAQNAYERWGGDRPHRVRPGIAEHLRVAGPLAGVPERV